MKFNKLKKLKNKLSYKIALYNQKISELTHEGLQIQREMERVKNNLTDIDRVKPTDYLDFEAMDDMLYKIEATIEKLENKIKKAKDKLIVVNQELKQYEHEQTK